MRRLAAIALSVFALVLMIGVSTIQANDTYTNGYVDGGYTYNDGYWWKDGQSYTRQLVYGQGYWRNGCYYYGQGYYQYTPYARVTYQDPDWKTRLLDIAKQRDKYEGEIRKNQHEQVNFLEAVKALGLEGNFGWNGYGATPPGHYGAGYGAGYTLQGQVLYGANATTQYGNSFNAVAQIYGNPVDMNQLYQAAAQLTQGAQRLAGDAHGQFSTLVGQEGTNQQRVAEILAKGQVAQQVFKSLEGAPASDVKGFSFKLEQNSSSTTTVPPPDDANPGDLVPEEQPQMRPMKPMMKSQMRGGQTLRMNNQNVDPQTRASLKTRLNALVSQKCATCHTGPAAKGGFDISNYMAMSHERKQKVWERLISTDEDQMMPRKKDGTAGERLTLEEQRLFFLN
jgi:mono/diheme cytochrome c family protein